MHSTQQALGSLMKRVRSLGVIVYLTQGARHSFYGQSTVEQKLRKSVSLLYEHYNAGLCRPSQEMLIAQCSTGVVELCGEEASLQIDKRHWLPPKVDPHRKNGSSGKKFSEGYRHMIRFFTVCLWSVVGPLGYQFVEG